MRVQSRISGLQKSDRYRGWLDLVLNDPNPSLDYFKFANAFKSNEFATNNHFTDLLQKLQKTKVISLRELPLQQNHYLVNTEFGEKYAAYWEQRNELRQNLYNAGFYQNFDLVTNEDAGFMELTIRSFIFTYR